MGRRKNRPSKHGTSAQAPVAAPAHEERPPASVLRMPLRDAGEALQARVAFLEGQDRQTLEALSRQVRERDERIRELERNVRSLESELSQRGEGANHLRLRERELVERVSALEVELEATRESLLDAQAQDDETASAALIAAFRNLVTRDLPKWSDRRDHFLRDAGRVLGRVAAVRDEAQRTLFLLRTSLERVQDLTGELALRRAGATGVDADELDRHALAREIKDLWETWQGQSRDFDEKNLERQEFLMRDAQDRRSRDQLRGKIENFVHAFALAGLDVWELAELDKSSLELLNDRAVEIEVVRVAFEIDRVSVREREGIAQATGSIVQAPPPMEKPRFGAAQASAAPASVAILPGCVFPAQSERELERLCLLAVMAWEETPSPQRRHPSAVDVRKILLSTKLVSKQTTLQEVVAALKAARHIQALASGQVREGDYPIDVFFCGARSPVCRDEALDLLSASTRERVLKLIALAVTAFR